MKKSIMLLGIIAIVLISFSPAYAQPFGHWHNKTISTAPNVNLGAVGLSKFNLTDFVFKRLVDNGASITTGYAIYEVQNPFPVPLPVATDYYEVQGSVVSEQYYIQKTEHYVDYTYTYKTVQVCRNETNLTNGTYYPAECWNEKVVDKKIPHHKTRKVWVKTEPFIPPRYHGLFKFTARFDSPAINPRVLIEWVPKIKIDTGIFDIGGTYFAQEKWAWWNTSWTYRRNITIDHTNIDAPLYNFTILVKLNSSNFNFSNANSSGYDIRFTDSSDNEIPYEREYWNSTGQEAILWVMVPYVNDTADTVIYMYYGNPSAGDGQNTSGTWDSHYVSVFHLRNYTDSASYGDIVDGNATQTTGLIDGAYSFNESQYLEGSSNYTYLANLTISAYFTVDTVPDLRAQIAGQTYNGTSFALYIGGPNDDCFPNKLAFTFGGNNCDPATTTTQAGQTYSLVGTYTNTTDELRVFVNGTFENSTTATMTSNEHFEIGYYNGTSGPTNFFNGTIDEVRLSDIVRSDAWIKADYYSVSNQLASVGSEETRPPSISISNASTIPANNTEWASGKNWTFWATICNSSGVKITQVNLTLDGSTIQVTDNTSINSTCANFTHTYTDLAAGDHPYTWDALGNDSSTDTFSSTLTIAPNSSNVVMVSISPSNFVSVGTETTVTCSDTLGGTLTLKKNGIVVSNPYTATLDVGTYVFNCSSYVNSNYTTNYATATLNVGSGETGGCSNNLTYAYKMKFTVTNNTTILNLSYYHDSYFTRPDLQDTYTSNGNITSINASKYLIINTTGLIGQNITVYWGNYLVDNNWATGTGTPSTITNNLTNVEEYNNYVFITFRDEVNQSNMLPPNANTTLDLFCSGGHTSYILYSGTNWTHFLAATYDNWHWVYATVKYSDSSFYKRHMGINNDHESITMWLIDAESQTVREVVNDLFDLTGDYTTANLTVKKWIGSSLQIVDWQPFDVSNLAYFYGIDGHEYEYTVSSGSKSRTLGNVVVSSSDLSKTLVINPIPTQNLEISGDIRYSFNYSDTSGIIKFYYYDPYNRTTKLNFTVRYYDNGSLVYYDEQNSTNEYSITYTVPDPNATYNITFKAEHQAAIGLISLSFIGGAISTLLPDVTGGFAAIWLRFVAFFAYIATILSVGKRYAQMGALIGGFILLVFSALKFLPLHPAFLVLYFVIVMLWIWRTGVKKATL